MFEKLTRYVTKMLTRRRRYVPALVALFVALLPQRVRAEEAVADTMEPTAMDGDDDEDGGAIEEGAGDDLTDEQTGEALDESSVGPEKIEMAGKGGEPPRRRRVPVEIGRLRTTYPAASSYPLEKCFVMPVGSGLYTSSAQGRSC